MARDEYFIGLMSGTSLDGVDIALIQVTQSGTIKLIDFNCLPLPQTLQQKLADISIAEQVNLEQLGQLNIELAKLCANGCNQLLAVSNVKKEQITAIGSHGVTIRHRPELANAFTMQITDPNTLAALTGIDVIADFRGMDMAFGGQGAPLVPKFHQALLAKEQDAIFVNLGGIANITVIEQNSRDSHNILGFDTGPANTLMNLWCKQHQGVDYDQNGQWAKTGTVCEELLTILLSDSYFAKGYPKSTGKEKFNLSWLEQALDKLGTKLEAKDVQATLLMLTVTSVAEQVKQFSSKAVYLCGGGAQNSYLVEKLRELMPKHIIQTTNELGVDSDAMEAMAFAWFAYCRVHGLSANTPSVTGARLPAVLGGWYSAKYEELN